VIESVEADLQHRSDDRKAASPDQVHDLLRDIGPLTRDRLTERVTEPGHLDDWLDELGARVITVGVGGSTRFSAIEDASRLRDAIGVALPAGLPQTFLEPVADPTGDVVARFARTHGPFTSSEAAQSLGLPAGVVDEVLRRLESEGRVAGGAYRPGGREHEWVDIEVLRRIRRRSLAVLRSDVEAVEPDALGRFLPAWQQVGAGRARPDHLGQVIRQLRGAPIPASILESDILPDRSASGGLDSLLATGELVWVGREPLGRRDGKLAFYPRDQVPLLLGAGSNDPPQGPIHEVIRRWLSSNGASFFADLYHAAGGGNPDDVLEALWDLVWAGEVTNDTLAPVRAFISGRSSSRRADRLLQGSGWPPAGMGRW